MSAGPVRFSSGLDRSQRAAMALALLTWIGGCSADSGSDIIGPPILTSSTFLVSDTVSGSLLAGAAGSAATAKVVYVSLAEGKLPDGTSARIRNWRTGSTVVTSMTAGGFDPVAIEAASGDTLEVEVEVSSGPSPLSYLFVVPLAAPPIVVRTEPADGKRDIPLNARIIVVFSEPIDRWTLLGSTLRLKRGSADVAGQVQFADAEHLKAEFIPDEPLDPGTNYELVATPGLKDLDGEPLAQPVTVSFTTATEVPGPAATGQIAFVSADGTTVQHIYLLDLERASVTQLTSGFAPDFAPAWSPDRARIAFSRGGSPSTEGTWVMNADGSGAVRRSTVVGGLSWSPDGTTLVVLNGTSMWLVSATASAPDLKVLDSIPGMFRIESPAWSPDGSTIAFEGTTDLGGDWFTQVYVMDADGTNVRRLTSNCTYGTCGAQMAEGSPGWSPDGSEVAFWSYGFGITVANRSGAGAFSVTHDGMAVNGSGPATGFNAHPSWSPDGQWLVFQSPWPEGQLAVTRADGSGQDQMVTNMPGGASSPAWSR